MNNEKNIVCYGDSNTWGYVPPRGERMPFLKRWPNILGQILGGEYSIKEEGLSGRYTMYDDPVRQGKNGSKELPIILDKIKSIHLLIIFLGTNDVLHIRDCTAEDSARGIDQLVDIVAKDADNGPCIVRNTLIISPPLISKEHLNIPMDTFGNINESSEFSIYYQSLAKRRGLLFLDAKAIVSPSNKDGVHLDEAAHLKLAVAIASTISHLTL